MTTTNNPLSITKIVVDKLFGVYNYVLPNSNGDISKLLLIYGDNGTGKTTILKLIFYLLSTKDKSGYKTRIAEIKFKKFTIHFQNGIEVGAVRKNASTGSYEYYIKENGKTIKSLFLTANSQNAIQIKSGDKDDLIFQEILAYLTNLKVTTFYLSDDRKMLNSATSKHNEDDSLSKLIIQEPDYIKDFENYTFKKNVENKLSLDNSIARLVDWIRSKIIAGSKTGEKNSQTIFSDIIKDYINLSETEAKAKSKKDLLFELKNLENKLPSFVNLGLIDDFDGKTLRNSINKATTSEQLKFLATVISPYLEGVNAKLKALENVERTLNLFISTVNSYFINKKITYSLNNGFQLKQNEEIIKFSWLSSGEKQLLMLLINTITSADDATIFIIDEPEISLNIKWQRKVISTLLAFSYEKNIQFILATHSFELLSAYSTNVSKLLNKNA